MAFRYRQVKVENGDVIDSEDWNANQREFAGEFNGNLDRDNFPEEVFDRDHIAYNAFHRLYMKQLTTHVSLDGGTIGWQNVNALTFESPSDGMVVFDWSGHFSISRSETADNIVAATVNVVTIRALMNGRHLTSIYRQSDIHPINSKVMYGALPVSAGPVRIDIDVRFYNIEHQDGKPTIIGSGTPLVFYASDIIVQYKKR